jgi:DNA-binding MarR family transcriptional regulator
MGVDREVENAIKLETLVPRLIRALFHSDADSPLVELPLGQVRVMRLLYAAPSTPSELSAALSLSVSAITQVANRLEALGLIERSEDCDDRRVRNLRLSEKGRSMMYRRQTARVRRARMALAELPPDKQQAIIDNLEELVAICKKIDLGQPDTPDIVAEIEQLLPPPPPYVRTEDPV